MTPRNKDIHIIISGGGTGGHVFPAIAIANALKPMIGDGKILFVGAEGKMEMEKVPAAGYDIVGLPIAGIQKKLSLKNFALPFKLIKSIRKVKKLIKEFKPDVVVGVGGYASAPALYVAGKMKIPSVIQEQNSFPGKVNRWLANRVSKICVAYGNMEKFFPSEKIFLTGNPVRKSVLKSLGQREEAAKYFNLDPAKKTVLIVGGSQGARSINLALNEHVQAICDQDIQLIWQTGKHYYETAQQHIDKNNIKNCHTTAFIERMDLAYAAADLVVSRAGAIAISEICLVNKPAIFVPFPHAADDHQTKNAEALVIHGASDMIKDDKVMVAIKDAIIELVNDEIKLQQMAQKAASMAYEDADEKIASMILGLID